ncbi:ZIP family metal transporter [Rubrobacter calidifluminis]|uniref:ZIP family metal transporter n=1 Tax=Rubrobacter calidifluminis TaxID=1392640 RepID=UPI00235DDF19|nr:ZIP family metal transporter [Rubrobacter calidifluminis]
MDAVLAASLAGAGFCASSLLGLFGTRLTPTLQSWLLAGAAGIILALSFADLLPESIEAAGPKAIACFATAFALMALLEGLPRAHHHHDEDDATRPIGSEGATLLLPFVIGFALHNLAEGFVVAAGAGASAVAVGGIGIGVMVHKIPEGGSLGAVLAGSKTAKAKVVGTAVLLGLVLPVATGLTLVFSSPGEQTVGLMSGAAGGVLCYLGSVHLLPEAKERDGKGAVAVFAVALLGTVTLLLTILAG